MTIELNHTIIPARDKIKSARFFAQVFGLPFEENEVGHFAPVRVNERLTLDFAQSDGDRVPSHHLAFKVSEDEFDAILARVRDEGIAYGSGPSSRNDQRINYRGGGRGVYFDDPDGHVLELVTAD